MGHIGSQRKLLLALGYLALGSLALVACRSAPPVRYYLLSAETNPSQAAVQTTDLAIVVGPIVLPDYLDRPQLVTRQGTTELVLSDQHRWAEPLDRHFVAVLAENVAAHLGTDRVDIFPRSSTDQGPLRRIKGTVTRFDVDATGRAELTIRWHVTNRNGDVIAPVRLSRHTQAATGVDHAARVEALAATVAAFSRDIVAVLKDLSREKG